MLSRREAWVQGFSGACSPKHLGLFFPHLLHPLAQGQLLGELQKSEWVRTIRKPHTEFFAGTWFKKAGQD
jgi:hypothetical protein